jgi:S1-C subfamily serine protease
MKNVLLMLLGSFMLGIVFVLAGSEPRAVNGMLDKSVKIIAFKTYVTPFGVQEGYVQGTGVSLGNGRILTEFHVAGGANKIIVLSRGRTRFDAATFVKGDVSRDFAIIEVKDKSLPSVVVAPGFKLGQNVIAIGNAGAVDFEVVHAKVTGVGVIMLASNRARVAMVMDNTRIRHGFSGGGVFNEQGELVGLTEALGIEDAPEAIMGSEIKSYLGEK